jgi:hypothetical protein
LLVGGHSTGKRDTELEATAAQVARDVFDQSDIHRMPSPTYFNELQLPAEAVAQQLGHTDRGALVRKLYGHPNADLQRRRIRRHSPGAAANVAAPEPNRRTTSHD